ncbi:MAG: hypothetical protein MO846_01325 [Candidatus Devosia symbiotica]|nr:hypothetical protein [Candidatus Devosia symbiotica]
MVLISALETLHHQSYRPQMDGDSAAIEAAVDLMLKAERPIFYTGGGVINVSPQASAHLRELAELTGFPVTSALMGPGRSSVEQAVDRYAGHARYLRSQSSDA